MDARIFRLARLHSFLPLAAATLMLGVAMSFTAPYLSLFGVQEAGMTPLQLGLFMTLIAASGVLASAVAGKWTDRHGRHRMLLTSALMASSLGFLLLCLLRSYTSLLVIGILFLGVGSSAMSLVFSFARVALPVTSHAERSLALATLRTVLSMAWVFGPSVGALVLAGAGFHGLFVFAAVSFAACSGIVWRMKDAARIPASTEPHYAGDPASSLEVTTMTEHEHPPEPHPEMAGTRGQIWRATIALTLIGLAANATMIVLPLYVVQHLRGTQLDVSIMLGLGALLEIPMMLALGARGARLDKRRWLAACAAVHVVYFVAVSASQTVHFLIPMQAFNAFVVAVTSCLGMVYIQDMMPRNPGAATALFFNASRVGSILSGVLSGALVAAMGYRVTFLACGGLALGAFVLFANPPFKSIALQLRGRWNQWREPAQ